MAPPPPCRVSGSGSTCPFPARTARVPTPGTTHSAASPRASSRGLPIGRENFIVEDVHKQAVIPLLDGRSVVELKINCPFNRR